MEAVASRDRVAGQLVCLPVVLVRDPGRVGLDVVQLDIAHLEQDRDAAIEQRLREVLDDLLLTVDRDVPAGQAGHVDVVVLLVVAEVDAVVLEAFAVEAIGDVELAQQVDGVLLEQPGPDALLDVLPVRASSTTHSMPSRWSSIASVSPAGPAPTMPTWVRTGASLFVRRHEDHVERPGTVDALDAHHLDVDGG